jgi:hypothetical protein
MSGGGGNQNTVSKFEPPDFTKGYYGDYLTGAANLAGQPYAQNPNMTIAPWNGMQDAAGRLIEETAMNSGPDVMAARGSNTAVSQGQYLGNPYATDQYVNHAIGQNADAMTQNYLKAIQPGNDAAMARAGAFGGSGWQQQQDSQQQGLAKQIGDMSNGYRMQNAQAGMQDYRGGVGQMLGANSQAPGFNQMDIGNAQALMGVGNSQNQYIQALLNQQSGDWNNQQNWQKNQLDLLGRALSTASGNYQTQTQSTSGGQPNWVTGGAGGLAALYGLLGNGGK